jgi:Mg-chelatase subunit ChlD
MTFDYPWWLLALPLALAVVWLVARWGARTVPRRQHRVAVVIRLVGAGLLVLAAAQPVLGLSVDRRTVLFLVDRSASIGAEARAAQEVFLAESFGSGRPDDQTGVVVFGADVRVDSALTLGRRPAPILTEVDGSATDLAGALRSAASLLPSEGSRRVVVLTDLVETTGDARRAAIELADQGITVDVVALDTLRSADALVDTVSLPAVSRKGDQVPVSVVVRSTAAGAGELMVRSGDGEERVILVDLQPGRNVVTFKVVAEETGFIAVDVRLRTSFDTKPENDAAQGLTRVLGPARVAVVEGKAGEAEELALALEAGGLVVETVAGVPGPDELLEYDAVVLVNLDKPDNEDAANLASFVEELGRGLVVVGGDQAYGLGDYHRTPLEAVLPVSSNPDDLVRRQPVAEVLVIDTSGSMGACHCNSGAGSEGGVVKTEIAKAGAALAIDALTDSDQVGVLTFTSGQTWALPLGPRPGTDEVEAALGGITPNGDTEIAAALEEALDTLRGVDDHLRHIVLFTDGWDPNDANLLPMAREIADAGVTLSVLGTGEGPGTTLERMADLGGGRYYPGSDLLSIPEIFVEETLAVARNLATEGSFLPILAAPSQVTSGLVESPPLLGYVLTKAKGTASVALEIGQNDPLLASWQRGLGRATAWTSDTTSRWSAAWVDWEGYVDFWGKVIRDALPPGRENPPEVRVEGGEVAVRYEAEGLDVDSTATARVRTPTGEVSVVPLARVAENVFEGFTRAPTPGAYWVAVTVDNPDGSMLTSSSGAVSSYEEEFAFREPDPSLGTDLAATGGGRFGPEPAEVFDPAPLQGKARVGIWPWLAGAALAMFLIDVTLRRLVLVEGDAAAWKEGFTARSVRERRRRDQRIAEAESRGEAPPSVSDSETLERLLRRKRR